MRRANRRERRLFSCVTALSDRIVVLEDDAIVEDGPHAVPSRAGGTYESLWDRQTGAFLEAKD